MAEKSTKSKAFKVIKVIGIIIGIIGILIIGLYFYITTHPQIIVGVIQKAMYQDAGPNSFEPINTPGKGEKADGQYKINDIVYGTEYPNSFLDITYPDSNREEDRPTLFYFHGGGFFGGSKNMGDPMAASDGKHEITCILTWKGKEPAHICEQVLNFHLLDATFLRDTR